MGELTYPIELNYRESWGRWEALREAIWQEMLDLFPGFTIERIDGKLVVEGKGPTLEIPDLLLGHTNKEAHHRGQFGEGTKIGWLVFVREGIKFTLHSGNKIFTARKGKKYGQPVMKVTWKEAENFPGARYEIDWPEDESLYEDRVVRPGDPRILYTDPFGRSILQEEGRPNIYVKGLWICKAHPYSKDTAFSYDLRDVELSEDRNIPKSWTIMQEIGRVWTSVSDPELLVQFYQAVKDKMAEKDASMFEGLKDKKTHAAAFKEVFGARAVLMTPGGSLKAEAEYRGAEPVSLSSSMTEALAGAVDTDSSYVAELEGASQVLVPDSKLGKEELRGLKMARRLVAKINPEIRVKAYIITSGASATIQGKTMRLGRQLLANPERVLEAIVHEMGHSEYGTGDATAEMVEAACKIGARLLLPYVWRG